MSLAEASNRALIAMAPRQIALIRNTIAADCNEEEFNLFMQAAHSYGLDPFRRQILPLVFNKTKPDKRRMSIIVARDGLRVIASRCRDYRPASEPAVWEMDDGLKGPLNPKGLVHCTVYLWKQDNRGDWFKVKGEADWDEFAPIKDEFKENDQGKWRPTGKQTLDTSGNWSRMPKVMLEKCAEAQALRAGWPEQFGGLHVEEEMDKARVLDLTASEIVEKQAEEDRLARIGHKDTLAVTWGDAWGIDYIPVGEFADRVVEWLGQKDRTSEEVSAFRSVNRIALQEFWAKVPGDALELKRRLEAAEGQPPLKDGPALLRHQLTESVKLSEQEKLTV
jgi:phage recombination protein Bet